MLEAISARWKYTVPSAFMAVIPLPAGALGIRVQVLPRSLETNPTSVLISVPVLQSLWVPTRRSVWVAGAYPSERVVPTSGLYEA